MTFRRFFRFLVELAGGLTVVVLVLGLAVMVTRAAPQKTWPVCSGNHRAAQNIDCVVDGDTIWISGDRRGEKRGEKIRLLGIDTPEILGKCRAEKRLAKLARSRLAEILGSGKLRVRRQGKDRFGRTLARVYAGGRSVGRIMVAEGFAVVWGNGRPDWCGGR